VHVVLRMLLRLDDLGIGQQKRIVWTAACWLR